MLVDLSIQRVWKWLVFSESCQQGHPVVELECLFLNSKVLVKVGDDLDELTHDVGEERNTTKHDHDTDDLLCLRYWCQVSITNSGKCGNREIA